MRVGPLHATHRGNIKPHWDPTVRKVRLRAHISPEHTVNYITVLTQVHEFQITFVQGGVGGGGPPSRLLYLRTNVDDEIINHFTHSALNRRGLTKRYFFWGEVGGLGAVYTRTLQNERNDALEKRSKTDPLRLMGLVENT